MVGAVNPYYAFQAVPVARYSLHKHLIAQVRIDLIKGYASHDQTGSVCGIPAAVRI